jgi:hypothetical protein
MSFDMLDSLGQLGLGELAPSTAARKVPDLLQGLMGNESPWAKLLDAQPSQVSFRPGSYLDEASYRYKLNRMVSAELACVHRRHLEKEAVRQSSMRREAEETMADSQERQNCGQSAGDCLV